MASFETDVQNVQLIAFPADGFVLDVGGGGEGIIGRLKGKQVISIDSRADELEETDNPSLKLTMDARKLSFIDEQFCKATAFFTLMYMTNEDKAKVFREVHRVLQKDGFMYVWDTKIDVDSLAKDYDSFIIHLDIAFPDGEKVRTGYGTSLVDRQQDAESVAELAASCGFSVVKRVVNEHVFFLKLQKIICSNVANLK